MAQTKNIKINFKPKQTSKRLLSVLKDREKDVIEGRFGLSNPEYRTLDSIGKDYGVTRERVRQIEDVAIRAIRESDSFKEARNIFDELKVVIEKHGGVMEAEDLLEKISDDKITQNHINFYLVLAPDFVKYKEDKEFKPRWAVDRDIAEKIHNALKKLHKDLTEEELLEEEKIVIKFLDRLDGVEDGRIDPDIAKTFLRLSKMIGSNALGLWGLTTSKNISTRGIRDKAYLVMQDAGSPLHFTEVADAISKAFGVRANPATTHNELIKDDRMVLVGRGVYALKEWGYKSGVLHEVIQQIIRERGPMTRDEIIDAVLKERYLKRNTILVNLQNPKRFRKDDEGYYHLV